MVTQNTSHAVMSQRHEAVDSLDLFPTPPWGTRALCEFISRTDSHLREKTVWEPACGLGHMARPLAEYFGHVHSSDVHAYGFGAVRDFLFPGDEMRFDWIITNPPFVLAEEFALTAIERAREGVALLVRTAFLEGTGRWQRLFSRRKPKAVLQFTERLPMVKGRVDAKASTATSYCWVVWDCRSNGVSPASEPAMAWIPPCRKRLECAGDYSSPKPLDEAADGRASYDLAHGVIRERHIRSGEIPPLPGRPEEARWAVAGPVEDRNLETALMGVYR